MDYQEKFTLWRRIKDVPALSVRQPWAWGIVHAGKRHENRCWRKGNPDRKFRGPVLIHAAQTMTRDEYAGALATFEEVGRVTGREIKVPEREEFLCGGIIGLATVVDFVEESDSPWAFGPGLVLAEEVEVLPFLKCGGELGFFKVAGRLPGPEAEAEWPEVRFGGPQPRVTKAVREAARLAAYKERFGTVGDD